MTLISPTMLPEIQKFKSQFSIISGQNMTSFWAKYTLTKGEDGRFSLQKGGKEVGQMWIHNGVEAKISFNNPAVLKDLNKKLYWQNTDLLGRRQISSLSFENKKRTKINDVPAQTLKKQNPIFYFPVQEGKGVEYIPIRLKTLQRLQKKYASVHAQQKGGVPNTGVTRFEYEYARGKQTLDIPSAALQHLMNSEQNSGLRRFSADEVMAKTDYNQACVITRTERIHQSQQDGTHSWWQKIGQIEAKTSGDTVSYSPRIFKLGNEQVTDATGRTKTLMSAPPLPLPNSPYVSGLNGGPSLWRQR